MPFFVFPQCGFTSAMAFVAPAVFTVLSLAPIFVANLLPRGHDSPLYFHLRHPNIAVRP